MRNIKLTLAYKGTGFHGWQRQKEDKSIQEYIENAVFEITGEKCDVYGCGRTDAGVHAIEYTCNFRSDMKIPCENIPYALNHLIPDDICIFKAEDAPDDFHSRYSVTKKEYVYKILNTEFPDVFLKDFSWHYRYKLDLNLMKKAASYIIGTHDFSAFCASGATVTDFTRTVYSLDIDKSGDVFTIDITGDGFLYNMVRIIAGTLAYVGGGRIAPEAVADIISSKDRRLAGPTAPPCGLYLKKAYY